MTVITLPTHSGSCARPQLGFDTAWQEFVDFGPNFDAPEWDSLFFDLDASED